MNFLIFSILVLAPFLSWPQDVSTLSTSIESQAAATELKDRTLLFNPVVGVTPRTVPKWKVTFQRSALNNLNTTFLANTISIGVHDRVDFGSAPVWYVTDTHRFNYSLKYNFWRSEKVDAALALAQSRNELVLSGPEKANMYFNTSQFSIVFHPEWLRSSVGLFYTLSESYLEAKDPLIKTFTRRFKQEFGLDWQFPLPKDQWLTLGFARLRDQGFSAYEETSAGAGLAYSIFRRAKLFSRPSIGYYSNQTGKSYWTFSTSFYEI
jgi:hypothetical protein